MHCAGWPRRSGLDLQQQVPGAIVIQSCSPEHTFSDEDQALFADRRMLLHDFPLFGRQLARFEQHRIGRGNLADIVHRRGVHQHRRFVVRHARGLRQQMAHLRHAPHVVAGFVGARLDDVARP